ncbi:hydrogenase-4 component G [Campylobacter sp. RM16192]|uniref:hydrogenase-4 component G n=1 Tax=Campylobacter sp. RM16192 TaxID=1660080 RepID=UPI001452A65B|nr:hydrogenase-4 component G [Campylobacter sp. RM16192]QCD52172.1 hypothetical protein CDOMC_0530 [Campylobacter sp. RM16192]
MQINSVSSNFNFYGLNQNENSSKFRDLVSNLSALQVTNSYFSDFQNKAFEQSGLNFSVQSAIDFGFFKQMSRIPENLEDILKNIDYKTIGYSGKDISSLSQNEASDLISDNGFFGITNTANRIADFVINGSGGDLEKLQAGKDGVLNGFREAERMWGNKLPEISQQTMEKTLAAIDQQIAKLGGNVLNVQA